MSNAIPGVPAWLKRAHNAEHISEVLQTLAKRERTRMAARAVSRHQSNPSKRHRMSHLVSSLAANSEHVAHYSISAGSDPSNEPLNRYADIYPYDRTRVVVCPGEPNHECPNACTSGRYLNANWVRELAGGKWWIATQAPLPHTAHAFLSVILEGISPPPGSSMSNLRHVNRVRTIVQLTQNLEGGMRKAHIYFPPVEGQSWVIEPGPEDRQDHPIQVTLTRSQTLDHAHCIQSVVTLQALSLTRVPVGEPVVFQHLLYASWPDHGVPAREDREGLLHFARIVDEANRDLSLYIGIADLDPNPPIMVNCSAGVGRTGAFIALCSLLRHYRLLSPPTAQETKIPPLPPSPLGPLPEELQEDMVAQEIDSLREQRPGMVQRDDQVIMIYETLIAAFASSGAGEDDA
ncbi:phosphatases II [Lentinus tigrinus ALCF2SS1-7]|uniref:Phosphatases II n=1 Tax=Lentinus tigrinus ALCF2SS1-6 TaxID=1328759 RepID=A0A5C2SM25_9APHY|nr:phosphatases II [Lentinus tigrinus ALCF2SS1-6]RPD82817.1 phosphatases II [Lentinus tigrinus ALCF2SS1-7]